MNLGAMHLKILSKSVLLYDEILKTLDGKVMLRALV